MKINLKSNQLILLPLLCGGVGALLRLWHYGTGLDGENLLKAFHPAGILVLLLTAAVLGVLFWLSRGAVGHGKYLTQFPACPIAAAGSFAAAAGILITAMITLVRREDAFYLLAGLFGIAAAGSLVFTGICRLNGCRPGFVFHTLVCIYFVVRLLSRYQSWSADPQLHDYCFQLLATVCAMLFSFHRASLDLKIASRRRLILLGLWGSYFCFLATVHTDALWLYLGCGIWMATNLGSLENAFPTPTEDTP